MPRLPKLSIQPVYIKRGALGMVVAAVLLASGWGARRYMNRPAVIAAAAVMQSVVPVTPAAPTIKPVAAQVAPASAPVVGPVVSPLPAPAVGKFMAGIPFPEATAAAMATVPETARHVAAVPKQGRVKPVVRRPEKSMDPSLKAYGKEANSALDAFEARLNRRH